MQFSVVIPTRNRAALLPCAIASVLAQTHGEFELIISNNDSSDGTQSVIDAVSDPRVRPLRTERALSMVDHWNWVVGHAKGEWVLYLCDDDALAPDALAVLGAVIRGEPSARIIRYAQETYYYDDGIDAEGNALKFRTPRPRGWVIRDSAARLRRVLGLISGDMPKVLNSAVRRDLIDGIRADFGRLFQPWAPDYGAGVLMLSRSPSFVDLRTPLLIWGKNRQSYGSGAEVDPAVFLRFMREFPEFKERLHKAELPEVIVLTNELADTLRMARELVAAKGGPRLPDVNPHTLTKGMLSDLRKYVSHGHADWAKHIPSVKALAARTPIWAKLEYQRLKMGRRVDKWAERFRAARFRTERHKGVTPDGKKLFTNIAEAALYYGRCVESHPAP